MGTIVHANGAIENVGAPPEAVYSIVPFYLGSASKMELTLVNADSLPTKALIFSYSADGNVIRNVERNLPPFTSITESVSSLFPAPSREIAYLMVQAEANVLTIERYLHVQARVSDYADPSLLTAVTSAAATLNPVLPYFVQGGDFTTTIQIVNPSPTPAAVSMMAYSPDGRILSAGFAFQLPPHGSMRNTAQGLLNLGAEVSSGAIAFTSTAPILVTEGIANPSRGSFVMTSAASADTSFVFNQRKANAQTFTGLTIANQNASNTRVRLRSIRDDGTLIAQVSGTLGPNASMTRPITEFVSDDEVDGFIHVSSDFPIVASALESSTTSALLANVPAMHVQPGYNPPTPSQFRIKGTVRRTGNTVGGMKIQITGSANLSLFTSQSGEYVQMVPPGRYTLEPVDAGYVFFPPTRTVTITEDDSVGNDFDASLIGPSPKPTLLSISPATIDINLSGDGPPVLLTATGSDFVPGAKVLLDNVPVATGFISATTLSAYIPQSFFQMGGTVPVSVRNPEPSFGPSGSLPLAVNNPVPVLASLEPASMTFNPGIAATVTVVGQNFAPTSIFELTPPCVSIWVANRISAEIGEVKLVPHCTGEYQVRVRTPAPGGGNSQVLSFTVK
jgi:hypothetical protein